MSPNLIFVLQALFADHVEKYGVLVTSDCQRSTYESRPEQMTPSAPSRHNTKRSRVGHCSKHTSSQSLTHLPVLEMQQSGPYTFNPSILYIILFGIVSQRRHRNTDRPFQMLSFCIVSFRFSTSCVGATSLSEICLGSYSIFRTESFISFLIVFHSWFSGGGTSDPRHMSSCMRCFRTHRICTIFHSFLPCPSRRQSRNSCCHSR
jgi:hypothetical protein